MCETLVLVTLQPSVATTCAAMLASVGRFAGLKPKLPPAGEFVITGAFVFTVQVYTTVFVSERLPAPSVAQMLNVRVSAQGVPASTWETLVLATLQLSVADTCAVTPASVGRFVGLQPRLPPGGTAVITGAVVSSPQI